MIRIYLPPWQNPAIETCFRGINQTKRAARAALFESEVKILNAFIKQGAPEHFYSPLNR